MSEVACLYIFCNVSEVVVMHSRQWDWHRQTEEKEEEEGGREGGRERERDPGGT